MPLVLAAKYRISLAFISICIVWSDTASGQTILRAPQAIAACLCLHDGVEQAQAEMQRSKETYEAARTQAAQLAAEAADERARVNSDDSVSVDSYKELLDRRDAAQRKFATVTATYATAVARYNDAVGSYNSQCEGKSFDADALSAVRQSLVCPR